MITHHLQIVQLCRLDHDNQTPSHGWDVTFYPWDLAATVRRKLVPVVLSVAVLFAFVFFKDAEPAKSQELEPRVYSAAPIDTNFVVGTLSNSTGNVSLDSSLPLSDVRASIYTAALVFTHTFPLIGNTATWAVAVPYLGGQITGALYGQTGATTRDGFPDVRLRFAMNLLGRALAPAEFMRRRPSPTLGVGVTVIAPTGTYDPTRLINIGSNRWSFKPEIGSEFPMGKWFTDLSAGIWVFGKNTNYFGGQVLEQAPLTTTQINAGYNFRPGQWLALGGSYYFGGATTTSGAMPINALSNSRYGVGFSQPLGPGFSAKLLWSHWLTGQYGQNFTTISATIQYRWFGRATP